MNYHLINFLRKNIKYVKILISIQLFIFYLGLLGSLLATTWGSRSYWFIIYCITILGLTIYFYFEDKKRISSEDERFRGLNLFFRYGSEIDLDVYPIKVKEEWSAQDSAKLGDSIIYKIQDIFLSTYGETPLNGKHNVGIIGVTDSNRLNDSRGFLRISFTGSRGAIVSRFLTYQILGKNLVLSKSTYSLGTIEWYDMAFYILVSPVTFPFWIYRWAKREYSIYSAMASGINNSFELYDIRAYFFSSGEIIANVVIDELKANDLYTPEVGNIITQIFNDYSINNNNGNQFNAGSGSINIDKFNN